MTDFVFWCPGRCGSILAAKIVNNALYPDKSICYTDYYSENYEHEEESYKPIIHTHNPRFIINAHGRKIVLSRNLFDAVLSRLIAEKIGMFHIFNQDDLAEFLRRSESIQINITEFEFIKMCRHYNRLYTMIVESDIQYEVVKYDSFKDNPVNLLKILNIPNKLINFKRLKECGLTIKTPIDKQQQVANYESLKKSFNDLDLKYAAGPAAS